MQLNLYVRKIRVLTNKNLSIFCTKEYNEKKIIIVIAKKNIKRAVDRNLMRRRIKCMIKKYITKKIDEEYIENPISFICFVYNFFKIDNFNANIMSKMLIKNLLNNSELWKQKKVLKYMK